MKHTFDIKDKNTREVAERTQRQTEENSQKSFEVFEREITYDDLSSMMEGKRYIDQSNDGIKRIVMRIGNDLYFLPLTKKDR